MALMAPSAEVWVSWAWTSCAKRLAESALASLMLRLPALLVGEGDVIQPLQLVDPLFLGSGNLVLIGVLIGGLIALQQLFQTGQGFLGVCHHRDGLHLQALELGNVDVDELAGVLEQPLGSGGEVGVAGAHADDQIRLPGDLVGRGAAGGAHAAQIQGMLSSRWRTCPPGFHRRGCRRSPQSAGTRRGPRSSGRRRRRSSWGAWPCGWPRRPRPERPRWQGGAPDARPAWQRSCTG